MDWSSVTSNLIVPTLIALATFAWSKIRGEKTASWSDAIEGLGKQLVHQLVQLGTDNQADLIARAQAWVGLNIGRTGIPVNSITTPLINAMIEHAIGDALAELRDQAATDEANLAQIDAQAKATVAAFATAEAEGRARVAGMKDLIDTTPDAPTAPTAPEQAK